MTGLDGQQGKLTVATVVWESFRSCQFDYSFRGPASAAVHSSARGEELGDLTICRRALHLKESG
jgi:hypothetical protein